MFLDSLLRLASAKALTATALMDGSIELGNTTVKRQIGTGEPMGFLVTVTVAADHTTGDETYEFDIVTATTGDLGTGLATIAQYVVAATDLAAGARLILPLPQGGTLLKEFLGVKAILGGTTPTITVDVDFGMLSMLSREPVIYPKNYAV